MRMGTRKIALTLAICLAGVAVSYAGDLSMGTWKLDEAKSKFGPGATKNGTVVYAPAGDKVKVTTDGVDGNGKPVQTEWVGMFDGKDYSLTGDASTTRAYKKIDDRTMELTNKKDGKVTSTGRIVLAADGKSRTVTLTTISADGKTIHSRAVYEKQ